MDLEQRLRRHMESEIKHAPEPNVRKAMNTGDSISNRQRLMNIALPVVGVVAVVGLYMGLSNAQPGDVDAVAEGNAVLDVVPADHEWEGQEGTLGLVSSWARGNGMIYALSTSPGTRFEDFPNREIPESVYASSDGLEWSVYDFGDPSPTAIAESRGLLYVLSTVPGTQANKVAFELTVSEDASASTFSPVDLSMPEQPGNRLSRVIGTDRGILVVTNSFGNADGDGAWSADGRTFESVGYPFPGSVERSHEAGETSLASVRTDQGMVLFASEDARQWRPVMEGAVFGELTEVGMIDGQLVAAGMSADHSTIVVYRSEGIDGPPVKIPTETVIPAQAGSGSWLIDAAIGEAGAALSFSIFPNEGEAGSNPLGQRFREFFSRAGFNAEADFDAGAPLYGLLTSSDLSEWALQLDDENSWKNNLYFAPDGSLVAQSGFNQNRVAEKTFLP